MNTQMASGKGDWQRSPLASLLPGSVLAGVGVWMLAVDQDPAAAFFFLLAGLHVPFAFADTAQRRRIRGDRRPFLEQPIFRFQGLIMLVAGVAFLSLGLWS